MHTRKPYVDRKKPRNGLKEEVFVNIRSFSATGV